jgi:hypothetical protein
MGLALGVGGRRRVLAVVLAELVEEPGRERLECSTDSVLKGQRDSQPRGEQRGE